ncbi:hypothetical protein [Streptomyces sp. NPDC058964]
MACPLISSDQVHHRPVGVVGDPDHGQAVKAQQPVSPWRAAPALA